MLGRLLDYIYGHDRLKQRGDRLFLVGEFQRAEAAYRRAHSVLRESDFRAVTLESLIRECAGRVDTAEPSIRVSRQAHTTPDADESYLPGLGDLFELAIAEKPLERGAAYRSLGRDFQAGYVALIQGDGDVAADFLSKASSEASGSFIVDLELGRALSLGGRFEEARAALARAERTSRGDREAVVLLAAVEIELGAYDAARERLADLSGLAGNDPEATFLHGKALAGSNRIDEALERFRQTAKLEPHFHEAFFEASRHLAARGDVGAAFQLLNRACSLAPDDVQYNRVMARLVLDNALDENAGLAACDRLMVTDEDNAWQYLYWIAELYIRRGWLKEARDPLGKALQLVPVERTADRLAIERRLMTLER